MKPHLPLLLGAMITLGSCSNVEKDLELNSVNYKVKGTEKAGDIASYSNTPNFLRPTAAFEGKIEIHPLLSSEDQLPTTGDASHDFIYGSMADGAGLIRNGDGTFTLINNIEADYSIARIQLDRNLKPISGEYILNAEASAYTAQCSGTLVTPEIHGFGPLYLSGGEWGGSSKGVFATDPNKDPAGASTARLLGAMGQWSVENAVPLGKNAYPGKTVVFIGDDESNNEVPSGQVGMYVSSTGDLENGKLYGIKVSDPNVEYEMDMEEGKSYSVEFVELEETELTALDTEAKAKGVMGFSRVEDIDWRKGSAANNREVYFCVTGRKGDALEGKGTFYGRVYKIEMDENNPTAPATITCVLDGDKLDGKANMFQSPDNIVVTNNYAYIQEDPNGYPDTPEKDHFARLYQYHIPSGKLETVLECDQESASSLGYGNTENTWEITGMIDVSDIIGVNKSFLVITQNHGWEDPSFSDPTAIASPHSNEGSVLYLVKGLHK